MRIFHPLFYLSCYMFVAGCTQPGETRKPDSAMMLLDNHGGYSHAGRRITLHSDGSYTDTTYTDVVGAERAKSGRYTLNAERTLLILSPVGGETQNLYRIDFDGEQYWVHEDERGRITQSSEARLRQISLRVSP